MGAGALGRPVATLLAAHDFPVVLWSRRASEVAGIRCHGADELDAFLAATRILVCLLPLTPDTEDLVDRALLRKLRPRRLSDQRRPRQARRRRRSPGCDRRRRARGRHARRLPRRAAAAAHPFWDEPRIAITPHCSALTQRRETLDQIVGKIVQLERGGTITGVVDRTRGY